MKLIVPAKNWQNPIEISPETVPLLTEVAKRLKLACTHDEKNGKLYLNVAKEKKADVTSIRFVMHLPSESEKNLVWGCVFIGNQCFKATSGLAGSQVYGQYWEEYCPIPPGNAYKVDSAGYYLDTKGIEGMFHHITPDPIAGPNGKIRSEFGIHRDANTPGSAGCIVIHNDDWDAFRAEMKKMKGLVELKVVYGEDR